MGKQTWIISSLLLLLFGFTNATAKADEFKVAMLVPGSISDAGWNALAYEGLKRIEAELGAQVSHVESKTPSQWEEHFRFYASKGYDLIFGHGFEYQEPAKAVAADFPETVFITTSGNTVLENVSPIVFELEEATYLLGIISGMMTKTGKIGLVGGMNIPPIQSTFLAFEAGAKSVNPDVKVSRSYVGDWENIGKAKELTLSQIAEGADFIFHNADAAGRGVFHAVEESRKAGKDIYAFGSNRDQNDIAPSAILASAAIDTKAFVYAANLVKTGKFEPKIMWMGMALDETVKLIYNPTLKDRIPEAVQAKVEEVRQKILTGEFKAPRVKF
ncbi:MAG: BMP family protein [Candidatus Poribacteria bacterium]|nr:BMP family protein [Candidatus Poribacteria bacterium]